MKKSSILMNEGVTAPVKVGTLLESGIHKQAGVLARCDLGSVRLPLWSPGLPSVELPATFVNTLKVGDRGVVAIPEGSRAMILSPYYKTALATPTYADLPQHGFSVGCMLLSKDGEGRLLPSVVMMGADTSWRPKNLIRVKDDAGAVVNMLSYRTLAEAKNFNVVYPTVGHSHAKFFLKYSYNINTEAITEFGADVFFMDKSCGNNAQGTPYLNSDYMCWRG